MKTQIIEIPPSDGETKKLFRLLDEHNLSHCPPEVCNPTQPEEMESIESVLLGVFYDGVLCGMGGLKYFDEYAEVTRMFLKEGFRGNGLAFQLLQELESRASEKGLNTLKLETSDKFESAVKLYKRYGFNVCEPFGEYQNKPFNTYMALKVTE